MAGERGAQPLSFLSEAQYDYWSTMPGFMLPAAAERLYEAARDTVAGGTIVELGSFAGKSLACLVSGMKARSVGEVKGLAAIDIAFHEQWPAAAQVFEFGRYVQQIESSTLDVVAEWDEPISLLYIDADHGLGPARADFVAWEPFVLDGGLIALDDTAGFYPGCTLQVQAAVGRGQYELVDDVGGVTFLRKNGPLFDGIGLFPLQRESAFAIVAAASAWSGAMDPELRTPSPRQFTLPEETIRARLSSTLRSLQQAETHAETSLRGALSPTLAYLQAVVQMALGELDECRQLIDPLAQRPHGVFFHYDLDIQPLAKLRKGQMLDLAGQRPDAIRIYEELAQGCPIDGVRDAATRAAREPFTRPPPTTGRLLRDYVLDSSLGHYRRLGPRP